MENQEVTNWVAEAIKQAGSQDKLAEQLGVTQQAMSIWQRRGWVPLRRAQEIEALLGIPRVRLVNPRIADLMDVGAEV